MHTTTRSHAFFWVGIILALLIATQCLYFYFTRKPIPVGPAQVSPDGRFELLMFEKPGPDIGAVLSFVQGQGYASTGYLVLRERASQRELYHGDPIPVSYWGSPWYQPHWTERAMVIMCGPYWPLPN